MTKFMDHKDYAKKHGIEPLEPAIKDLIDWAVELERRVLIKKIEDFLTNLKEGKLGT